MIIYIDIDDTICYSPDKPDYTNSIPNTGNIIKANELYDNGHTIIYWTARGLQTGIDWSEITLAQFKSWGVKFHDLKFGKPYYDIFIDDKNINTIVWDNNKIEEFFKTNN